MDPVNPDHFHDCEFCGRLFERKPHRGKPAPRFCSKACVNSGTKRTTPEWADMAIFLHTFCKAGSKMIAKILRETHGVVVDHVTVLPVLKRAGVHDPVTASETWGWMANRPRTIRRMKEKKPKAVPLKERDIVQYRIKARAAASFNYYSKRRGQRQRAIDAKAALNPAHRIKKALRLRIWKTCKRVGALKSARTEALVGCSITQLRTHLESKFTDGMTWDNYGQWHVDHITPCISFDLTNPDQQRQCFHYTNLQPLWAFDNHSKHARMPIT